MDQIRGSRTNSAARASWWVPLALGTNFSPLSTPHEIQVWAPWAQRGNPPDPASGTDVLQYANYHHVRNDVASQGSAIAFATYFLGWNPILWVFLRGGDTSNCLILKFMRG